MSLRLIAARATRALAVLALAAMPSALAAQRGEVAIVGGIVQSPGEEFDRVIASQLGAPTYQRQRGVRESGNAVGATATFAIRGHVFGELGIMRHGVERCIARTALGDADGPLLTSGRFDGTLTTIWMGPSYRLVDRERFVLSAVVGPMVLAMDGDAFDRNLVSENAPSRSAALGALVGLRARLWLTDRLGAQLSLDDAMWTMPLSPHPTDDTPLYPDTYRATPRQHDLRLHLGAAYRLF